MSNYLIKQQSGSTKIALLGLSSDKNIYAVTARRLARVWGLFAMWIRLPEAAWAELPQVALGLIFHRLNY
ncbi:MAG: hypothetical protein ABI947_24940 [Chloroflexota bacterium]